MKTSYVPAMLLFSVALAAVNKPVLADYGCNGQYGQYGGCSPTQTIIVDKLVGKPLETKGGSTVEYVDNLTSSDTRFKPGDQVYFKIKVKNNSQSKLTGVVAKDYVPSYLNVMEGPGAFDTSSRIVTVQVGELKAGEEKIYTFKMQVVDQNNLPTDKGLLCLTNKAEAISGSMSHTDTAQFCVEKQVTGAKAVPATGPEMGILLFAGEVAALAAGLTLKKKFS